MKLFKSLLVTQAILGLLAPVTTAASEINVNEMNNYARNKSSSTKKFNSNTFTNEEIVTTKNTIKSIKAPINAFEAGSFSETTTMSGAASFQIGAVDESDITQAITSTYAYDLDLNTSFTGEDNLYVGIETGNSGAVAYTLDSSGEGADTLSVTSMYYRFPLGKYDIAVGPLLDVDDLVPTTTSKYSDSFYFGGNPFLSTNFYVTEGTGAGIALARTFENGINASGSIIGTGANTSGFLTDEGLDVHTFSLGYDADNYGGGIIYASSDSLCTITNQFVTTTCNDIGVGALIDEGFTSLSIGGYWDVTDNTSISATMNTFDSYAEGLSIDKLQDFQIGIDQKLGEGILSASWKTVPFYIVHDLNGTKIDEDHLGDYIEVYYTYEINDSLVIKPGISYALPATDAGSFPNDDVGFFLLDQNIYGIEATFKF